MKVAIGSTNPVKVGAVKDVFHEVASLFIEMKVPSGVSAQPISDEETIEGAVNRARQALTTSNATLAVGLEGGVVETSYGMFVCNWGALVDREGNVYVASGARFPLPEEVANEVRNGLELGVVMDRYANKENVSKQEGAVGIFTNGLVTRQEMYTHLVKLLVGQYQVFN